MNNDLSATPAPCGVIHFVQQRELQKQCMRSGNYLTAVESMAMQLQEQIHQNPDDLETIQRLANAIQEIISIARAANDQVTECLGNLGRN